MRYALLLLLKRNYLFLYNKILIQFRKVANNQSGLWADEVNDEKGQNNQNNLPGKIFLQSF
jgi:hypothetical protein